MPFPPNSVTQYSLLVLAQYAGRAPHLVRYFSVDPALAEEMGLAMKCLAHRLVEGTGAGGADFDVTICAYARYAGGSRRDVLVRHGRVNGGVFYSALRQQTDGAKNDHRHYSAPGGWFGEQVSPRGAQGINSLFWYDR